MDDTWPLSPLNPNSPGNQTIYVYGTERAEVVPGEQREMGPVEATICVLVIGLALVIIFAPMFRGNK